ncbi:MAG: replication initiator protein A [Pyrinomonadaceae bacterium]|nr:replication initiator protein A [Pyrinomonadaceae bacterium]
MKKKTSKSEAKIEATQETSGFTTSDFIKVEKNLTSLGFFTPSTHKIRTPQAKEVSFTRTHEGKRERVSVTIAPSVLSSLPTTADQDKYLAFQKIITDRRQDGEAIRNPISFTSAELLRSLDRRVDAGKNYDDIESWLDRMTSTTVISKSAVYFAGRKSWATDRFHVFERAVSIGQELPDGTVADKNYVWLSEWQLENINNNYVLPIDFETYKQLKNYISKALVPILQVWLYTSQEEGAFEKRYDEFCQYLNVRQYEHLSKIKEKLSPALDELVAHGYIASWQIERASDGESFKVVLNHGRKFFADGRKRLAQRATATGKGSKTRPDQLSLVSSTESQTRGSAAVAEKLTDEENALVEKLLGHGLHHDTAMKLVRTTPEEVSRQLDYLPYRTVKKNKGGMLRDAILGQWTAPDDYLEIKKRQLEQQESQERSKKKKAEETEAASRKKNEEERKRTYFRYMKERLTHTEKAQPNAFNAFIKDEALKRAELEADPANKGAAKKIYLRLFDDEESHLERFREFFNEPTLEEWSRKA